MLLALLAVVIGFAILIWSADRFVVGASALAANLGVSPLVIGLTIVGIGTSAPEMMVSGLAAAQGNPGLGVGNAIGSNIANMGLILGITALVRAMDIGSRTLRRELPLMIGATLLAVALVAWDSHLGRWDGGMLFLGMAAFLWWLLWTAQHLPTTDPLQAEICAELPPPLTTRAALFWLVIGLALLLLSSRSLVWGAVEIAHFLGVSDLIIGLTIVAIGTSLPELATCIAATRKNEADLAIGNIIGSNLFNLLAVLALTAVIAPSLVEPAVIWRDLPVLLAMTFVFALTAYGLDRAGRITRFEGGLLLFAFVGYQGLLYMTAKG